MENQENQQQEGQENEQQENQQEQKPTFQVSEAEYKKLLADLDAAKNLASSAKEALKGKELEQMKAQEKWKEIAEMREAEAREAHEKYSNLSSAVSRDRKFTAIKMAAQAAGLRKEALDDLELYDFPEVQIQTTSTGSSSVIGVKEAIDNLKVRKPYLFGKPAASLNSSSPEVISGGKITLEQVRKAQDQFQKTKSKADLATYQNLVTQFKRQG